MEKQLIEKMSEFIKICPNRKLDRLFSDKTGIINAILQRNELERFGYVMYQSLSAKTQILFDNKREVSSGGLGISKNRNLAFLACIGESVERYCMSFCPEEEILLARKSELPVGSFVDKHELYTKDQYKKHQEFLDPDADDQIFWTKLTGLEEETLYWPASLVYLPFSKGNLVAETSSTGVAAGISKEECVLSGLLELIERDALMINYLQRLNPLEIDLCTLSGENAKLLSRILEEYQVKIYKLYTDIKVPVYSALIWTGSGEKIHFGIGASAALSSDVAIEKSLKECLFTYFYSQDILDLKKEKPEEVTKLYEHFLFYQGRGFSKLLFSSDKIPYKREEVAANCLLNEMREKFGNVFYKDLTTQDVKESELTVVKVVVPGLVDINKSYVLRREAAERLFNVPRKLKLKSRKKLSSLPHPFP